MAHDHDHDEDHDHEHDDEPTADDVMAEAEAVAAGGAPPERATEAEVVSDEEGGERFSEPPEMIEAEGKTMEDELPGGEPDGMAAEAATEPAADSAEKDEE